MCYHPVWHERTAVMSLHGLLEWVLTPHNSQLHSSILYTSLIPRCWQGRERAPDTHCVRMRINFQGIPHTSWLPPCHRDITMCTIRCTRSDTSTWPKENEQFQRCPYLRSGAYRSAFCTVETTTVGIYSGSVRRKGCFLGLNRATL